MGIYGNIMGIYGKNIGIYGDTRPGYVKQKTIETGHLVLVR